MTDEATEGNSIGLGVVLSDWVGWDGTEASLVELTDARGFFVALGGEAAGPTCQTATAAIDVAQRSRIIVLRAGAIGGDGLYPDHE